MKFSTVLFAAILYAFISCTNHNAHNHEEHDHTEEEHAHEEEHEETSTEIEEVHEHEEDEEHAAFGIKSIVPQAFSEIIRTSGEIMPAQGDEVTLTAIHDGIVMFSSKTLLTGKKVNKSEQLFTISGEELIHDNIRSTFFETKNAYERALENFERAKKLNVEKIISDKELTDTKLEYEKARIEYDLVKRNYTAGGQRVTSSINGFIKNVLVSEGEYVTTGQPLIKLTKNKKLTVKADVPQRFFPKLKEIKSANFKTVYDNKLYNSEDLNGRLVSFGKSTEGNSLFTPVYFEVDNVGELLAGSYVEIFLKTVTLPLCIVIPKTALLEEAGRYYVYIENEAEEKFEKRFVTIDCNDGFNYHVTKGIEAGEFLVTKNPYQIKLASLSNALPEHSHSH